MTAAGTAFNDSLDAARLETWRYALAEEYRQARPSPHAVIDDFVPDEVLDRPIEEFPGPDELDWKKHSHRNSEKLAWGYEDRLGPQTRALIRELNSARFIRFLEGLTGIDGLIPDPLLHGGGLHQIERGGLLGVHADFNFHPEWHLDRRINLLLYLNKDWREAYGGHLELWNADMSSCIQRILPVANRCVIFNTAERSFHGHPEPLRCPEGMTRKSIALYYYSNGRPAEERSEPHTTIYRDPVSDGGEDGRRATVRTRLARRMTEWLRR